jgi:hypothetical protein
VDHGQAERPVTASGKHWQHLSDNDVIDPSRSMASDPSV